MKLERAITSLSIELEVTTRTGQLELHDAVKLGIEAMNRIEILRHFFVAQATLPLPGETEE